MKSVLQECGADFVIVERRGIALSISIPAMSIAISVNVQASKILGAMQYALFSLLLLVALTIYLMPDIAVNLRYALTGVCVFVAILSVLQHTQRRDRYRLVVSNDGKIYLTCLVTEAGKSDAQLVQLATGSTIWPSFMLLRLRNDAGKIYSLALMHDSTSADSFRALAVAVRCIIRRKSAEKT